MQNMPVPTTGSQPSEDHLEATLSSREDQATDETKLREHLLRLGKYVQGKPP